MGADQQPPEQQPASQQPSDGKDSANQQPSDDEQSAEEAPFDSEALDDLNIMADTLAQAQGFSVTIRLASTSCRTTARRSPSASGVRSR